MARTILTPQFKPAWRWPADVEAFISTFVTGFSVNLCCGTSKLGSLLIDSSMPAHIKADMRFLPLRDACVDTVICDPPWNMDAIIRPRMMRECARILRPGGRLLLNAMWCPRTKGLKLIKAFFRRNMGSFGHVTMLFIYERKPYNLIFPT